MATTRRRLLGTTALAAAASLTIASASAASSVPDSADDFAAVETAAADEGTVVVYASTPEVLAERLIAAFNETYPDITVEFSFFTNAELASRVEQERTAGSPTADIVGMADFAYFSTAEAAGQLAPPTGPSVDDWPADFRPTDSAVVVYAQPLVISWNTERVETPITSYQDALAPELQGAIASTDIASGSIVAAFYDWLRDNEGPEFWELLAAQEPTFGSGAQAVTQSIAAGEESVGLFSSVSVVKGLQASGAPIEYVVPSPSFGVGTVGAILESAPHPNAAQVLMNWLMSEDGQTAIAGDQEYSSPLNVAGAIPIDTLTVWRGEQTPEEIEQISAEWAEVFQR